jgi:plastocyanin
VVTRREFVAGLVLLLGSASVGAAQRSKPKAHKVMIDGMVFKPSSLTINAGDSVTWVNNDIVEHTATASSNAWDSKMIAPSKSWKHTFTTKGSFDYACKYHPTMKGTLVVR